MRRLEAAYEAITGSAPPRWTVAIELDDPPTGPLTPEDEVTSSRRGPSVREMVLSIVDEDPDKVWDYDGMRTEFDVRGRPLGGKDPKATLRTAVWALAKDGQVERVGPGGFRRMRHATVTPIAPQFSMGGG